MCLLCVRMQVRDSRRPDSYELHVGRRVRIRHTALPSGEARWDGAFCTCLLDVGLDQQSDEWARRTQADVVYLCAFTTARSLAKKLLLPRKPLTF